MGFGFIQYEHEYRNGLAWIQIFMSIEFRLIQFEIIVMWYPETIKFFSDLFGLNIDRIMA